MSIRFPKSPAQVSDRKYHEAGVRGRFENNLRIVRGRINTTTPTILQGVGFSVVRNGTGDATITFDPPFSDILSITATAEVGGFADNGVAFQAAPTDSTARLVRFRTSTGASDDGIFHFVAAGPA